MPGKRSGWRRSVAAWRRRRSNRRWSERLRLEPLEPRILLTTFMVTTDADAGAGSLRDAIDMANMTPNDDAMTR